MEQSDIELLQTVSTYHLQTVVKARHLPLSLKVTQNGSSTPSSTTSSTGSSEVAQHLFAADSLRTTLAELSGAEVLILQELVACGGRANSRDLALYLTMSDSLNTAKKSLTGTEDTQDIGPVQTPHYGSLLQYPVPHPHGNFEQALRQLLLLGLLFWGKQTNFSDRDYSNGIHDGVLIVPLAVQEVVRQVWQLGKTWEGAMDKEGGDEEQGDPGKGMRKLQRHLYLYWSTVATLREGLSVLSSGLLARSSLRIIAERLGTKLRLDQVRAENEVPYLLFLRLLLMHLGLLQERKGVLHTASADAFFSLPLLERARRCYHLAIETELWNELLYLPDVAVRPGPSLLDPAHEEVIRSRTVVIERLIHEPIGRWCDLAAFVARTKLYAPYLLFPRSHGPRTERYSSGSNPYGWDFRLRRGWLTHREGWHVVEGGFVKTVITGPLNWLGLVELDRETNPSTFRILPTAIQLTSTTPIEDTDTPWSRLIVQPNFELVALAPVSELLLVTLDRFAEQVSLEHIAQYRLTKASVARAIQRGINAETIKSALERAVGGEIPQNVAYSLAEWERQTRRVELWPATTLLEVDDASLLDTLFADPSIRGLFGRRLSPLLAEVKPQQLPTVQQILWQRNYLPALTPAPTQENGEYGRLPAREPQWRLHDDGLLQPFYAVSDLYLTADVERFCTRDETSSWYRVTAQSLQRGLQQGISLEYVIRFLQHYCEGGIPGSLLIRLKLWGGGYSEPKPVQVERTPLLSLPAHVLEDLQGDEEIQQLLGEEIEHDHRLVRVDEQHVEQLIALLRERGFPLD